MSLLMLSLKLGSSLDGLILMPVLFLRPGLVITSVLRVCGSVFLVLGLSSDCSWFRAPALIAFDSIINLLDLISYNCSAPHSQAKLKFN